MRTIAELQQDILNITMKIENQSPELSKYLKEIPVKISEKDKHVINVQNLQDYHDSLVEMLAEYSKTHAGVLVNKDPETNAFPGYPLYPASEDMYYQGKKEKDLNPNDLSKIKTPNEEEGAMNEIDFEQDMVGGDLDVPGSELDDQQESVGSEDEENNYYSLGGDDHNDLEEDRG